MKRAVLRTLVVLLLVGTVLWALAPVLQSAAAKPKQGADDWTQERMDAWLTSSRAASWALTLAKGLPVLLGIGFLVQEILRADRERGLLAAGALATRGEPLVVAAAGQAVLLGVFFPIGIQLAAGAFIVAAAGGSSPSTSIEQGVLTAVLALLPPALIVALRRQRLGGRTLPSVRTGLVEGVRYACIAILLVLPVGLLWALALVQRGAALHVQEVVETFARPANAFQPWLIALFGAFVAPFTEEAVFRGLLYPSLRKVLPGGAFGAAVAVSLLFAAIHGSLVAFVPLFVLAMLLAGVMERTNSLLACVVVHAIHNGTSLVPMMVRVVSGGGS